MFTPVEIPNLASDVEQSIDLFDLTVEELTDNAIFTEFAALLLSESGADVPAFVRGVIYALERVSLCPGEYDVDLAPTVTSVKIYGTGDAAAIAFGPGSPSVAMAVAILPVFIEAFERFAIECATDELMASLDI